MSLTVEWLITQRKMENIKLLAGENGISRVITNVNIIDNPDTIGWLTEGELILSTGYFLQEDSWLCHNIVQELSRKKCSGLGLVLKRYMNELPEFMIELAEEYCFPIIAIPYERSMATISNLIYSQIFKEKFDQTEVLIKNYRGLADLMTETHDSERMMTLLYDSLANPFLLLDKHFFVLEQRGVPNQLQKGKPLFHVSMIKKIKKEAETLMMVECKWKEEKEELLKIFPIAFGGEVFGYFCVIEKEKMQAQDYDFLRTIKLILAMELMEYQLHKKEKAYTNNAFLNRVLLSQSITELELTLQCRLIQFDYTARRICILCKRKENSESNWEETEKLKRVINKTIEGYNIISYMVPYLNNFIIFLFYGNEQFGQGFTQTVSKEICEEISTQSLKQSMEVRCGISHLRSGIMTIRQVFQEATDALDLGSKLYSSQSVHSYDEDYAYHKMNETMSEQQKRQIYEDTVEPLFLYDKKNKTELYGTLVNYLKNGMNLSVTAKELFIHRNTMFHRMEKIVQILGTEIKDIKICTKLQLGIYAQTLLNLDEGTR